MRTLNTNKGLRWWVLIIALINPAFSYLAKAFGLTGRTIGEVSMQYNNYFMPAGYAFSIWGLIYLSFIVYGIYQLLPHQQRNSLYDRLSMPFIASNLLGMLWQVVFVNGGLIAGTVIIVTMLVLAGIMFRRVKVEIWHSNSTAWLTVPFSLYVGWLSVANIANAAVLLTAYKWDGGPLSEQQWAITMILTATALAIFISLQFRDRIYPLVVAWTFVALYIANKYTNDLVATDAIIAAVVLSIYTLSYMIWQYLHQTNTVNKWPKGHHNRILKH